MAPVIYNRSAQVVDLHAFPLASGTIEAKDGAPMRRGTWSPGGRYGRPAFGRKLIDGVCGHPAKCPLQAIIWIAGLFSPEPQSASGGPQLHNCYHAVTAKAFHVTRSVPPVM
jgi:hypothetical protein